MKKTIVSILAILPFFLIVLISILGRQVGTVVFVDATDVVYIITKADSYGQTEEFITGDYSGGTDRTQVYTLTIEVDEEYDILSNASVLPTNATYTALTLKCSNTTAISISNSKGTITGLSECEGVVLTISHSSSSVETKFLINVVDENLSSVEINKQDRQYNLGVGLSQEFTYSLLPSSITTASVTCVATTSNADIASVSSISASSKKFTITGVSAGEVVITITATQGDQVVTDTITVTVVDDAAYFNTEGSVVSNTTSINILEYITVFDSSKYDLAVSYIVTGGTVESYDEQTGEMVFNDSGNALVLVSISITEKGSGNTLGSSQKYFRFTKV